MKCSCNINVPIDDWGDGCVSLHAKMQRSMKVYKCDECRGTIKIGVPYYNERYISGGAFYTHRTCHSCKYVRDTLFICGFYYGMLWDDIQDSIRDGMEFSEKCIADLPKPARDKLCDMIEANWGDE